MYKNTLIDVVCPQMLAGSCGPLVLWAFVKVLTCVAWGSKASLQVQPKPGLLRPRLGLS